MPVPPPRIQVRSINFGATPFRKLRNLEIKFADRLTLIAGHNGIGKSTILGLVANTFGITAKSAPRSYFGEPFSANIERIVYLALDEVAKSQIDPSGAPVVSANVHGVEVHKRCAMTQRSEWRRARVVPRTIGKVEEDPVGQDAKIPLPTIYLGIKRLTSIGEADEKEVESTSLEMHEEDSALMVDFVRSVILGSLPNTNVTHQNIKGSRKKSAQPGYDTHDAQAISVGQDSLGSIATALASFNRLKRDSAANYSGGLLIIDELDAGFHPHAIATLAKTLKRYAERLMLQIIATTHSPRLIEAIHPDGGGNTNAPDRAIYLVDTRNPRLAEDQSLDAIRRDMDLKSDDAPEIRAVKPALHVYFEDLEGSQYFSELIPLAAKTRIGKKHGVSIKLRPIYVGGSNMVKLPDSDPIFRTRILSVDSDTTVSAKAARHGNIIKLPCVQGSSGTNRSPENTIKNFLRKIAAANDGPFYDALLGLHVTNPSSDLVMEQFLSDDGIASSKRESSKKWWTEHWSKLKRWKVIPQWAASYPEEVKTFVQAFEAAVETTSKQLKK